MATLLFLNENPLPRTFTKGTIAGKELRLRAAIPQVKQIHVLTPVSQTKTIQVGDLSLGPLEAKITIHPLIPFPYYFRFIPLFLQGFFIYLKYKPSLVEAESPIISGLAGALLKSIFKCKLVIEYRASYDQLLLIKATFLPKRFKHYLYRRLSDFSLSRANGCIANSKYYHQQLQRRGFHSVIINPGLQYPPLKPTKIRTNNFIIGYLGRLVPEKGVSLLLDAVSLLNNMITPTKIAVEIAGDGPEKQRLKRQAQRLKLAGQIKFLGLSPNYQTLARWSLLINPNLVSHPLEMVNAEAAYMGVPVICFGSPDTPETVIHHRTGIKLKQISAAAIADAILTLYQNPKTRQALGRKASEFAHTSYRFENQVTLLKQLYLRLGLELG
jgi:glycosyltransferase involved in cell wall biosynthesis